MTTGMKTCELCFEGDKLLMMTTNYDEADERRLLAEVKNDGPVNHHSATHGFITPKIDRAKGDRGEVIFTGDENEREQRT